MSKLAFRLQTVDIAYLPLHQDLLAKNVLMTAQRDYGLGNRLLSPDPRDRLNRVIILFTETMFPEIFRKEAPILIRAKS